MLPLLLSFGLGLAVVKWLNGPGEADLDDMLILILLGLIISSIYASILKRDSKIIVKEKQKLSKEKPKPKQEKHFNVLDVLNILNNLASYFTIFYFWVLGMCMLGAVMLYGYLNNYIILVIIATIVIIDIVLFFACYSSTKSLTDSIILMQYIEAGVVKAIFVSSIILAIILVWYSIAFIFLCLAIIGFGSKFGG
ncbi:MAG: hypothetical protein K6B70_05230 [Clostridia bacterium]|nr:hypothetical protein [Clostridia bacterium]